MRWIAVALLFSLSSACAAPPPAARPPAPIAAPAPAPASSAAPAAPKSDDGASAPLKRVPFFTYVVDYEPSWSPDGKHVVLISNRHGGLKVHVADAEGSDHGAAMKQLTFGDAEDDSPAWSPDGKRIAFVSVRDRVSQIFVMNADGGDPKPVTRGTAENIHPAWTPDGSRILIDTTAFAAKTPRADEGGARTIGDATDDAMDLATIRPDGTDLKRLTTGGGYTYASYSPDGRFLVHRRILGKVSKIFVMNADGTGARDVSGDGVSDGWPAWSPDGAQIAFARQVGEYPQIFVMNRDGTGVRQLTDAVGRFTNPRWSPDGKTIVCSRGLGNMSLVTLKAPPPAPSSSAAPPPASAPHEAARAVKVTILSTMLANEGLGEWGFSALVEIDGVPVLFDTGAHPDTVLKNAADLKIDLSKVTDVILSHNHDDHTGGLVTLRRELMKKNPAALSRAHVAPPIFWSRPGPPAERNTMITTKKEYEALGGTFVVHPAWERFGRGVFLSGPVPRVHPEKNYGRNGRIGALASPSGVVNDDVPEDMSLVVVTDRGLVIVTGCGHAGIVNGFEQAVRETGEPRVHAAIGGFHLFQASEDTLKWTADRLAPMHVAHFIGAHCTGVESLHRLRTLLALDRKTAVVGAVGATFELGKGIDPREIAQ